MRLGAAEHSKILKQFGLYKNPRIASYVSELGARVARDTERKDVQYKFYVIDSPIVNAFALPGGYIYLSRGLMALANDEAELAGVIAHEIGHITGRHSAERYSQSVVTKLGATVLSILIDQPGASDALGLGSNLYLASYSRGQETEADSLGLRYLSRAGYDPKAMANFLNSLKQETALQDEIAGKSNKSPSYLSTHPATSARIAQTARQAGEYVSSNPKAQKRARNSYLNKIEGMIYGDSQEQGFTRGQSFYHPKIGFSFKAPPNYRIINKPSQVIMSSKKSNAVIIFDLKSSAKNPKDYLAQDWLKGEGKSEGKSEGEGISQNDIKAVSVGGMEAATASFDGSVNGSKATIRLMAVKWSKNRIARFQVAIPRGTSATEMEALKRATYSLRHMSDEDKARFKPYHIKIITASSSDTISSLAKRQPFNDYTKERFRVLNGLSQSSGLIKGQKYKLIGD